MVERTFVCEPTSSMASSNNRLFHVGTQMLRALNPFPDYQFKPGQRVELRSRPEDIIVSVEEPKSLPASYSINNPIVLYSGFEGKYWHITLINDPDILYYGMHHSYIEPSLGYD